VDQILQFNLKEISIDARVGREKDTPISDYLVDESIHSPEESLIRKENKSLIRNALSVLNQQEQSVIAQRYGFGSRKPRTLKEIGAEMGISRERVRQIECQAKERLRRYLGRTCGVLMGPRREGVVPERRGGARLSRPDPFVEPTRSPARRCALRGDSSLFPPGPARRDRPGGVAELRRTPGYALRRAPPGPSRPGCGRTARALGPGRGWQGMAARTASEDGSGAPPG
jgi:hypothetical protein